MTVPPKKERQHHVWQNYLAAWRHEGGVWCRGSGKIFRTGTRELAVERNFYRINTLTKTDLDLLDIFISKFHEPVRESHRKTLLGIISPLIVAGNLRNGFINTELLDAGVDAYKTNALENFHMGVENAFISILNDMKDGSLEFFKDDKRSPFFFNFISTQHMRTKGIKERTLYLIRVNNPEVSFDNIWNLMAIIMAQNLGCNLYIERKRRSIVILDNLTSTSFIAGDQPSINLTVDQSKDKTSPPTNLIFYLPISPKRAIVLNDIDSSSVLVSENLTKKIVMDLNRQIYLASHQQIFGLTRESVAYDFNLGANE